MALVAYENSDSSEFEDDENEDAPVVSLNNKVEVTKSTSSQTLTNTVEEKSTPSLFNLLPQPSTKKQAVIEEDDEFLHKKETAKELKPKARITVPSLSDFKDVEDRPVVKPKVSNGKKSGLLNMLPQPKNAGISSTTSLIPHVLTKRPVPTSIKKKPLPSPIKKAKKDTSLINNSDDSDNDDEETTDFFSINKVVELPEDVPSLDIDTPVQPIKGNIVPEKKTPNIQSYFKQDVPEHMELEPDYSEPNTAEYSAESSSSYNGYPASESSSNDLALDEEAIRQLCGSRVKRKKEDIQIVDVNQKDVLADAREWLVKGLMDDTSKRVSSSKKRGDEPTSQQKRKHQITYLAHQAKAKEAELQNQWANSRMSRRQTQSKYGF